MAKRISGRRVRQSCQFIEEHRHQFPVEVMCRILEVAPSGYYEWLKHPISNRAQEDSRRLRLIHARLSLVGESTELHACFSICERPARRAVNIESSG
jgi:hypothetical protein